MKDEFAKYLLINSNEIEKQIYTFNSSGLYNNSNDISISETTIKSKEIFDKYDIPEKFQKIIIKVNMPFVLKNEAEEYTMGFPFDLTSGKVTKENDKNYINITASIENKYNKEAKRIAFKTEIKYLKFKEIINFLRAIYNEGYIKNYLSVIKELFDISLDLEYLIEVWNQEKNVNKAIKKYELKYKEDKKWKNF